MGTADSAGAIEIDPTSANRGESAEAADPDRAPGGRSLAWSIPTSGDIELVEVSSGDEPSAAPDSVFVLRHEPFVVTPRARKLATGAVVVVGLGSDALFFPHAAYMIAYGGFVAILAAVVLRRLWNARSA
jgi:hypothetical protein